MDKTKQYISTDQFGAMFMPPLKRQTIEHWRCHGKGPEFVRLNGRIYYDLDVVRAWMAKHQHGSTAGYTPHQSESVAKARRAERAADTVSA